MDERDKIPKDRWKGWKIRETQGKMERMNDQEFSHLGGSVENWKYSRLVGMDGRLEMLKVRWQVGMQENTRYYSEGQVKGQVGCMKD